MEVIEGVNLKGKEIVVTGAASGLGIETAKALAKAGARVVIAARDLKRAEEVAADIKKTTGNNNIEVEELELASIKSVDKFVERYLAKKRPLHILVNNAGVMNTPEGVTEDGFETQFGINHIGHFALTVGLLPALKAAKNARVINLSSMAHWNGDINFDDIHFKKRAYNGWASYAQSKTANVLFAVELTRRFKNDGITSNALMPGVILTNLTRYMSKEAQIQSGLMDEQGNVNPNCKTIEQGAATTVWAAVAPELEGRGGLYLEHCQIAPLISLEVIQKARAVQYKEGIPPGYLPHAVNPETAKKLWEVSEIMVEEARKARK